MTFTPSRPGTAVSSTSHRIALAPEIAALKKLRMILITEIAIASDRIARIDNRIHKLRSYEQVGRIREESKATAEAAAESAKAAGEA